MGRPLLRTEIEELRAQRAQGIEETVLATSWGISRASVARHTQGVVRVVDPSRSSQSRQATELHGPRNDAIRASSESVAALAERFSLSEASISRIRSVLPKPLTARERFANVAAGAWRADCMTDEEWTEWVAMNPMNVSGGESAVADRPCSDCPLGFAADMRALGKCNGTPGWQAPAEEEEEEESVMTEPRIIPNGTEVVVALEAPCGRCAHEPVCAIKRSLDGLDTLPVSVPRLDKALTMALTAAVDCSQFMAIRRPTGTGSGRTIRRVTDEDLVAAVEAAGGNLSQAAQALGISKSSTTKRYHDLRPTAVAS